ncbi:META domain-containing protein [bacterium]|nr:META domain-containing protein [bacterium]
MFTPNRWIKIVALLALFALPAACIGPQPSREATPAATGEEAAPTAEPAMAGDIVGDAGLTGSVWELAQITTRDGAVLKPNNSAEYSLAFGENGTVTAQIGACNRSTGSYVIAGDQLTFGMMDDSIVACPPDSLVDDFAAGLTDARSYSIQGDTLRISTRTGVMTFTPASSEGDGAMGQTAPSATAEPAAQAALTGTVTYVERIALPTGATITVRLVDVSRADAASELIAEQVITAEGEQVPFPFELTYDPAQIVDSNRYAMQAFIELEGQLLFISDTLIPVLTMDAPSSDVEIMVGSVPSSTDDDGSEAPVEGEAGTEDGSSEATDNELTGVVWQWQRTQMNDDSTTTPATPANYTLEFATDGSVAIQADCNSGSGPYTQEANLLSFGAIAITLMGCPDESQADAFMQQLSQVGSYFITEEGNLILEIQFDSGSMIFAPTQ